MIEVLYSVMHNREMKPYGTVTVIREMVALPWDGKKDPREVVAEEEQEFLTNQHPEG